MRKLVPYIFFFLACLLMVIASSCSTRKVETSKERSKVFERSKSERTAPGAQIVHFPPTIAYPLPENPYPRKTSESKIRQTAIKDTVINGPNGATATVSYHPDGHIRGFVMDCPPVSEKTESERSEERRIKERQSEREMNVEIAQQAKQTVWGLGLIFAIAWVVKGLIS